MYYGYPLFFLQPGVQVLLAVLVIWSLVWKALALWKAARLDSKV